MCCCYNTVSSWQVGYFCSVWSRLVRLTTIRAYDSFVFVFILQIFKLLFACLVQLVVLMEVLIALMRNRLFS